MSLNGNHYHNLLLLTLSRKWFLQPRWRKQHLWTTGHKHVTLTFMLQNKYCCSSLWGKQDPFQYEYRFPCMTTSIIKIRRRWGRPIFMVGIPLLARPHLYIEPVHRAPFWFENGTCWSFLCFSVWTLSISHQRKMIPLWISWATRLTHGKGLCKNYSVIHGLTIMLSIYLSTDQMHFRWLIHVRHIVSRGFLN